MTVSGSERRAMEKALELAALGRGSAFPNPMVGAVVLSPSGEVLGRGYHRCCGGPHAEVEALKEAGGGAQEATIVVTLEPCCHTGRTGPCTLALLRAGVSRAVVAMRDPNPEVAGRGIEQLRRQGVEVEVGLLADRAAELNRAYLHHLTTGRSLVVLKMACTLDGRVAAADGSSRWITGKAARRRVHMMRSLADCVMVGAGTALRDDPELTVRLKGFDSSRGPARLVVADSRGLPSKMRLLRGGPPVIVALPAGADRNVRETLKEAGALVWQMPEEKGMVDLQALLRRTADEGFGEVMCEGGPKLATDLLSRGLAARGAFFVAPALLGGSGVPVLGDLGIPAIDGALRMRNVRVSGLEGDALLEGEIVYRAD